MKKLIFLIISLLSLGINTLLGCGHPSAKIKYYRGDINAWKLLGLKTVNL